MNNRPSTFEFLTITGFGIVILAALGFAVWSIITLINWTWLLSIAPAFSIAILCVVILAVSAFLGAFDSAFSEAESEGDSTSFE